MSLRSAKYVNNDKEAHVKEPNKEHDRDHAGKPSEGHGRDQGEEAREEAHQPRGATPRLQIPPVQASSSREGSKKECHQDGPRSTKMRPADRDAMIMPEWLIHRYHQEERIDETDRDQQYCRVIDQEALDEYYSSTPDVLTKPLAEDKLRTSRRQMYGHEPEQAEAKDDGPAPENMDAETNQQRTERIHRLVQLWSERDLTDLSTTQRAAREQEMASAYQTFDEEGLDTALTIAESMAPAKAESGGEWTPPPGGRGGGEQGGGSCR
jgi:hypothetical protein